MTNLFRFLPEPVVAALTPSDAVAASRVLSSEEFSRAATRLGDELNRDATAVRGEAAVYLREMAAVHLPVVV
ncbi:MAG: hypothetical protein JWR11_1360, partial [Mycobacterium sp.]|nr:hypothetical protein [Mycobacterium sp.]